jgi:hypothetical protein
MVRQLQSLQVVLAVALTRLRVTETGELRKHGKSLYDILTTLIPDHKWNVWCFADPVPLNFWNDQKNRRAFLDWYMEETGMKGMDDWYKVRRNDILAKRGTRHTP